MSFITKETSEDPKCRLRKFKNLVPMPPKLFTVQNEKSQVPPDLLIINNCEPEIQNKKKLEVLYDGYYYDVTDFIKKHPGGDIIDLYTNSGEDATIAIQQFHYRSLKTVLAKMKGLPSRPANETDSICDEKTRNRYEILTKDFQKLTAELEAEGFLSPSPGKYLFKMFQALLMLITGLLISHYFGHLIIGKALSLVILALAGGQYLWLGHDGGHNSFTGIPKIDKTLQICSYGFVFGLSASCWNSTHVEHHAMPQHEINDADLRTMPLIAFNKRLVRNPKDKTKFWLHYQHLLFIFCDTFIVVLTWKFNHHLKFVIKNKCWLDLICMICHYSLVPLMGLSDWLIITWLSSIYILGNLVLSHTHFPVVKQGKNVHWVEYAFLYTTNVRSSWWVDWWMGNLNYQIEHHLFPTMPEYKGKLIRNKIKKFAKDHDLPYHLCTYWEAVKSAYLNLENVANEIRQM